MSNGFNNSPPWVSNPPAETPNNAQWVNRMERDLSLVERKDLQGMIWKALDAVGGENYLAEQAIMNPKVFIALLAKMISEKPEESKQKAPIEAVEFKVIQGGRR